eukprot:1633768-Amphidinium_carterae.1
MSKRVLLGVCKLVLIVITCHYFLVRSWWWLWDCSRCLLGRQEFVVKKATEPIGMDAVPYGVLGEGTGGRLANEPDEAPF